MRRSRIKISKPKTVKLKRYCTLCSKWKKIDDFFRESTLHDETCNKCS